MASKKGKTVSTRHKSEVTYWTRFGLAILSAIICASLRLGIEGIAVGVVAYLISYVLARYLLEPSVNLGKYEIYLVGSTTYFVTWLTLWILLYTLMVSP